MLSFPRRRESQKIHWIPAYARMTIKKFFSPQNMRVLIVGSVIPKLILNSFRSTVLVELAQLAKVLGRDSISIRISSFPTTTFHFAKERLRHGEQKLQQPILISAKRSQSIMDSIFARHLPNFLLTFKMRFLWVRGKKKLPLPLKGQNEKK